MYTVFNRFLCIYSCKISRYALFMRSFYHSFIFQARGRGSHRYDHWKPAFPVHSRAGIFRPGGHKAFSGQAEDKGELRPSQGQLSIFLLTFCRLSMVIIPAAFAIFIVLDAAVRGFAFCFILPAVVPARSLRDFLHWEEYTTRNCTKQACVKVLRMSWKVPTGADQQKAPSSSASSESN